MSRLCPHCRAENSDAAAFCLACGRPLSGSPSGERPPTRILTDPVLRQGGSGSTVGMEPLDPPEIPPLPSGMTVGNWTVERVLGKGGMGTVYLARHSRLGHHVALKALSPLLTADPGFRSRFEREASTQARLQHPHIAQVLDFIEHDGGFYIVIERLAGGTLRDLMQQRNGPLETARAVEIARQALSGLAYAHAQGVVHRDITSSNVMLDGFGAARVTDFGIAIAHGVSRQTSPGVALGTPQYMSPEQITRPLDLDARADIYSIGIVLYEMLTGRVPFDGDNRFEVMRMQTSDNPPSPRGLNPSIPARVEAAVLRALGKHRDRRYASCAEFAAALEFAEIAPPAAPQEAEPPSDQVAVAKPQVAPAPALTTEKAAEAIGTLGSLLLLPWLAFWFGEFAASPIESLLHLVGIDFRLLAWIKRWHEAYSGWSGSGILTILGFVCWAICVLGLVAVRLRSERSTRKPA